MDIHISFDNSIELGEIFDISMAAGTYITDMYVTDSEGSQAGDLLIDDVALPSQSKSVTLGASTPLPVTPDTGYVLNQVNFSLDSSVIKAENIAEGTSILGINGTHHSGITPTGTLSINANGNYDVTNYANASVSVPSATEPYREDTIDITRITQPKLTGVHLYGYTAIPNYAFYNCSSLTSVLTTDCNIQSIGDSAFAGCSLSVENAQALLSDIEYVSSYSFGFALVTETGRTLTLPNSLVGIYSTAFRGCTSLQTVVFNGTPQLIQNAFTNCANLTNIYVPWSEGAVAGAPWGATNATVHYNS